MAVNKEHGICAYGWLDCKAVHLMSTADGTGQSSVLRKIGKVKKKVNAPKALPRYNKAMQAVDRADQLLQLFSMTDRHHFKKWYKQFFLAILDFALLNADIHYHTVNKVEAKKKYACYNFFKNLGHALIRTDWSKYIMKQKQSYHYKSDDNESNTTDDILINHLGVHKDSSPCVSRDSICSNSKSITSPNCNPIDIKSYFTGCQLTRKKMICQICVFEGRGRIQKSVAFCAQHHIRACLKSHPDHTATNKYYDSVTSTYKPCYDWSWICPDKGLTCWEKLHQFYIPNNLFTVATQEITPNSYYNAHIKRSCNLLKQKNNALKLAVMGNTQSTSLEVPPVNVESSNSEDSDSNDSGSTLTMN